MFYEPPAAFGLYWNREKKPQPKGDCCYANEEPSHNHLGRAGHRTAYYRDVLVRSIEAGNEANALALKITNPKLVSHGVEMTLAAAGGRVFKTGDEPTFALKAVNTTDDPVTFQVRLAMTATARPRVSRVLIIPTNIWQEQRDLELKPSRNQTPHRHHADKIAGGETGFSAASRIRAAGQPTGPVAHASGSDGNRGAEFLHRRPMIWSYSDDLTAPSPCILSPQAGRGNRSRTNAACHLVIASPRLRGEAGPVSCRGRVRGLRQHQLQSR